MYTLEKAWNRQHSKKLTTLTKSGTMSKWQGVIWRIIPLQKSNKSLFLFSFQRWSCSDKLLFLFFILDSRVYCHLRRFKRFNWTVLRTRKKVNIFYTTVVCVCVNWFKMNLLKLVFLIHKSKSLSSITSNIQSVLRWQQFGSTYIGQHK